MSHDFTEEPPKPESNFSVPPQPAPGQKPPKSGNAVLITLLIVGCVGVVGFFGCCVAIGLLVPAVQKVREAAARVQTENNLKVVVLGMHSAHDAYKKFPYDGGNLTYGGKTGTCLYHVLPFIEQQNVWNQGPAGAATVVIPFYTSPQDDSVPAHLIGGKGGTSFAGNSAIFNATLGARMPANFKAGTANTVMLATVSMACSNGGHTHGGTDVFGPAYPFTLVPGSATPTPTLGVAYPLTSSGLLVAMADRSVRTIAPTVTQAEWRKLWNPDGSGPPGADWDQ